MLHKIKLTIRPALALILCFGLAAPAAAQAKHKQAEYDIPMAHTAFKSGKESGLRPSTTDEYLMCAGYWSIVSVAVKDGYISNEQLGAIGPEFKNGLPEMNVTSFMARGGGSNNADATFTRHYNDAAQYYSAFILGEEEGTRALFETLGICAS